MDTSRQVETAEDTYETLLGRCQTLQSHYKARPPCAFVIQQIFFKFPSHLDWGVERSYHYGRHSRLCPGGRAREGLKYRQFGPYGDSKESIPSHYHWGARGNRRR